MSMMDDLLAISTTRPKDAAGTLSMAQLEKAWREIMRTSVSRAKELRASKEFAAALEKSAPKREAETAAALFYGLPVVIEPLAVPGTARLVDEQGQTIAVFTNAT